jgi:hypothetical protein
MSVSREPATAPAGVSFEVDRFAWVDGRLEVTGRWYGIRGRRFLRPTLDVEVDGAPRRMLAVLEHKPWAADDGEEWVAAFEWSGEPVELAVAELAVAPELAVVLPPPTGAPAKKKARGARATGERRAAAPPRAQALEAALAEAQAEVADLRNRLAAEQKAWQKRVEEVEALRDESAAATRAAEAERDEAVAAREKAIAEREELVSAREAANAEHNAAVAARDEAVAARDAALADAEHATTERDKAVRQKAVLEKELAATARARDKARAERNEWLTRARDAAAGQGPAPREGGGGAAREGGAERAGVGGAARQGVGGAAHAARQAVSRRLGAARRPEAPAASEDVPGRHQAAAGAPQKEPARPQAASSPPQEQPGGPQAVPPEEAATAPLPRRKDLAPAPAPPNKPRKEQIPPGGILLPPTHPGSHMRHSLIPAWAPRVLAPVLLVALVVVIVLLIAWAF